MNKQVKIYRIVNFIIVVLFLCLISYPEKKIYAQPGQLEDLGTYISRLYGEAEIYEQNRELKIRLSAHPKITGTIQHWQYNTFLVKWTDVIFDENFVYFDLDDQGGIKQFRMSVRPDWIDTWEYTFVKSQ